MKKSLSLTPQKSERRGKKIAMPKMIIESPDREKNVYCKINVFVSKSLETHYNGRKYFLIVCPEDAAKKSLFAFLPSLKTVTGSYCQKWAKNSLSAKSGIFFT